MAPYSPPSPGVGTERTGGRCVITTNHQTPHHTLHNTPPHHTTPGAVVGGGPRWAERDLREHGATPGGARPAQRRRPGGWCGVSCRVVSCRVVRWVVCRVWCLVWSCGVVSTLRPRWVSGPPRRPPAGARRWPRAARSGGRRPSSTGPRPIHAAEYSYTILLGLSIPNILAPGCARPEPSSSRARSPGARARAGWLTTPRPRSPPPPSTPPRRPTGASDPLLTCLRSRLGSPWTSSASLWRLLSLTFCSLFQYYSWLEI